MLTTIIVFSALGWLALIGVALDKALKNEL